MSEPSEQSSEVMHNLNAVEAAEKRAYERGEANAKLRAQVDSHERRLDAINGSIGRSARAQEATNDHLDALTASVEKSAAVAKTRADVAAETAERLARTSVDKRTFVLTVILASAGIASVLIGAIALMIGHV